MTTGDTCYSYAQHPVSVGRRCLSEQTSCALNERHCIPHEGLDLQQSEAINVIDYLNAVPEAVRSDIITYLRDGNSDAVNLREDNFHHYLHTANYLHYSSLIKLCLHFYKKSERQVVIRENIGSCDCREILEQSYILHQCNSESWRSLDSRCGSEDTIHPEYAVMFMKRESDQSSSQELLIMNMHQRCSLIKQKIKHANKFGKGFATCSMFIDGCPYIVISGGHGRNEDKLWKYDVIINKWVASTSMFHSRKHHIMAFSNDKIYIIGGKNCSLVEQYDPVTNTCRKISHLPVPVYSASYIVHKNFIYIFGGKTSLGNVSSVQCLNTKTGRVTQLSPLPCQCSGGQAVVIDNNVFYCTNQGHLIKFDVTSGESVLCAQQPFRRKNFVMYTKRNKVYIFGGTRKDRPSENVSTMYKYCLKKDIWVKDLSFDSHLPIYASCIVRFPRECPIIPFVKLYPS